MTKEEIIDTATIAYKKCNHIPNLRIPKEFIETFAKLIAEKEREAIEKRVMELDETMATRVYVINKAIRERGQE